MAKHKTIAEYMKEVLLKNDCDGVMYGDLRLLDECADKCKHTNLMKLHPLDRHQRILNALEKSKLFKKNFVRINGLRGLSLVRNFDLISKI